MWFLAIQVALCPIRPIIEYVIHCDSKGIPINWVMGKEYPVTQYYALCRCGGSKNKPFCDSSHYPEELETEITKEMGKGELKDNKGDLEDILKTKKRAVILFYASWCPFSQAFLPIYDKYFEKQPQIFLRLMIDDREELMERFSVEVIPTVIFFENGAIKRRCDGEAGIGLSEKRFIDIIDSMQE